MVSDPSSESDGHHTRFDSVRYPVDIVYISTCLNVGGAEKSIKNLVRGLPRAEFRPHVIGLNAAGRLGNELDEMGVSWESLGMSTPLHPESLFQLINRLEERSPDIVHAFQFQANMLGRVAALLAGVPAVVSTVRDCDPSRTHLIMDGFTHGMVDREICEAPSVRDYVHEEAGVPSEKLMSIPGGVDPERPDLDEEEENELLEQIDVSDRSPLLLAAGRLTERKGFHTLIDALPKLVSVYPDLVCVIFGEGPMEERLREQIDQRDLTGNVILAGWTDRLRDWLSLSDVFVLPSHREGLPNVLLEAISMEVPFVATRTGGVPDLLHGAEQSGGLLVEAKSARMLSSALETVLDRSASFQEGVRRFAGVVREEYSVSKMVARHHSLYKDLISEHVRS